MVSSETIIHLKRKLRPRELEGDHNSDTGVSAPPGSPPSPVTPCWVFWWLMGHQRALDLRTHTENVCQPVPHPLSLACPKLKLEKSAETVTGRAIARKAQIMSLLESGKPYNHNTGEILGLFRFSQDLLEIWKLLSGPSAGGP